MKKVCHESKSKRLGFLFPNFSSHLSRAFPNPDTGAEYGRTKTKIALNVQTVRIRCLERISNGCRTLQSRREGEGSRGSSPPSAARELQPPRAWFNKAASRLSPVGSSPRLLSKENFATAPLQMRSGDILREKKKKIKIKKKAIRGC